MGRASRQARSAGQAAEANQGWPKEERIEMRHDDGRVP